MKWLWASTFQTQLRNRFGEQPADIEAKGPLCLRSTIHTLSWSCRFCLAVLPITCRWSQTPAVARDCECNWKKPHWWAKIFQEHWELRTNGVKTDGDGCSEGTEELGYGEARWAALPIKWITTYIFEWNWKEILKSSRTDGKHAFERKLKHITEKRSCTLMVCQAFSALRIPLQTHNFLHTHPSWALVNHFAAYWYCRYDKHWIVISSTYKKLTSRMFIVRWAERKELLESLGRHDPRFHFGAMEDDGKIHNFDFSDSTCPPLEQHPSASSLDVASLQYSQ